jgi:hypothetical protein
MNRIQAGAVVVLAAFCLVGCFEQSNLNGKWDVMSQGNPTGTAMQFDPDGTVTLSLAQNNLPPGAARTTTGHYKLNGHTLTMTTAALPTGGAAAVEQAILVHHFRKTHKGQMPPPLPNDHDATIQFQKEWLVLDPHFGADIIILRRAQ